MDAETTILVADDHPLFRDALKAALARACPGARVLEAGSVAEALAAARAASLDLILLDLKMSDSQGFAGLALLHAEAPTTPIVVVTAAEPSETMARAREYGAAGYLNKSASLSEIERMVRATLAGERPLQNAVDPEPALAALANRIASLTPAQLKVLIGLLDGRLNKQIAYEMNISEATVKAHMTAVFRKLNVRNRTQAVLAARALALDVGAMA